jgi:hypothetical protein
VFATGQFAQLTTLTLQLPREINSSCPPTRTRPGRGRVFGTAWPNRLFNVDAPPAAQRVRRWVAGQHVLLSRTPNGEANVGQPSS